MLTRIHAQTDPMTTPIPEGQRLAFGWPVAEAPAVLQFAPTNADAEILELRLTNAWDVRQPLKIAVTLARSGEAVGEIDASYSPVFVPLSLVIDRGLLGRIVDEGLALAVREGDGPFRFHLADPGTPIELSAHLQLHDGKPSVQAALDRVASLASIQMFGWEEGCVVDALTQLNLESLSRDKVPFPVPLDYAGALAQHWKQFLTDDGQIRWEFTRNSIHDGRIEAIESTIMYAFLPSHGPLLEPRVEAFWKSRTDAEGCVLDTMTSCEGCYTVAFPMARFAMLALMRNDLDGYRRLREDALLQLRLRRQRLSSPEGIFLRRYADGRTTHFNWSRGIAWYLLGFVRAAEILSATGETLDDDILAEIDRVTRWALSLRDSSGLWHCFAGEPETGLETSGTAGICAAIATACDAGMIDRSLRRELDVSWEALKDWLTPDGLLRGVAPSNRAGEAYQRTGVRAMSPFGLGLWGQFAARMM